MDDGSRAVTEDGGTNMAPSGRSEDPPPSAAEQAPLLSDTSAPDLLASKAVVKATASASLRAARQALGLSVADVAARTRITLRHIESLEAGDYGAMQGRPYVIGFAKAYARAVGLDDIAIAEAVRTELEGSGQRPEPRVLNQFEVGDPAKTPSRLVGWLSLLVIAAILAMGGVFWRSYYAPAVSLPSLVQDQEQTAAELTRRQAASPPAVKAPPATNGPVVFTALEEAIWVKFYDGQGRQLMQKQLAKGESYTVPGDAVGPKVWTGRPDALAITIGGQAVPRLAEAEKVMKDVPIDAASLLARQAAAAPPAAIASQGVAAQSANR